jgi:hypothetical protein
MNPFCAWMIIEWFLIKFVCFVMIWNPRWPLPQDIVLTQDHMGKYRNIFFSEVIALIEPKLCINHWKVLYKLCVFYCDRNSKMTTTVGHSFYIGPIGSFYDQVNDTGSGYTIDAVFHAQTILYLTFVIPIPISPLIIAFVSGVFILYVC